MLLDKFVASFAGMAATLYFLSGCMAWYRLLRPRRQSPPHVRSVILDRAIAWSSLAVLFGMIVSIKLGYFEESDDRLDVFRIVCLGAIYVCGLISIRSITMRHFGYSAVSWFAGLSAAVGVIILIFL
jgi:hypothetical protein